MEWLNYHHLRYFWTVARKGGVRKAAEALHVSQPSISAQLRLLEESLGQKLFRRSGRNLVLTETGQLVLNYADEIFSAGRELMNAVKQRPGKHAVRLNIGLTDSFPKLIAFQILQAAFRFETSIHIVCREGEIGPLVNQLQAHRSTSCSRMSRLQARLRRKHSTIAWALGHYVLCCASDGGEDAAKFPSVA